MIRRDFFKTPLALAGLTMEGSAVAGAEELAAAPGLTRAVAEFVVNTRYEDIPNEVIALAKRPSSTDSASRWQGRRRLSVQLYGATSPRSAPSQSRQPSSEHR